MRRRINADLRHRRDRSRGLELPLLGIEGELELAGLRSAAVFEHPRRPSSSSVHVWIDRGPQRRRHQALECDPIHRVGGRLLRSRYVGPYLGSPSAALRPFDLRHLRCTSRRRRTPPPPSVAQPNSSQARRSDPQREAHAVVLGSLHHDAHGETRCHRGRGLPDSPACHLV